MTGTDERAELLLRVANLERKVADQEAALAEAVEKLNDHNSKLEILRAVASMIIDAAEESEKFSQALAIAVETVATTLLRNGVSAAKVKSDADLIRTAALV